MKIRQSTDSDRPAIAKIHLKAFGENEGPEIAELVNGLLDDKTAQPILSLVAQEEEKLVGHVMFTKALLAEPESQVSVQILAPLAVLPDAQRKGVGSGLVKKGLKQLQETGVDLVFVLGNPKYYGRFGFESARFFDFKAPYQLPEKWADAWMVQELKDCMIGSFSGKIQCAEALDRPEYWIE